MTDSGNQNATPVYVKTSQEITWPNNAFFYLLTADGLFFCRNHPFFRSCTLARNWPSELATQHTFLASNYPRIPRPMFAQIVGFFSAVADLHGSEAGVLLAWDNAAEEMLVVVPPQRATVGYTRGGNLFPIGLEYETPTGLPAHWTIIGDVHSHVDAGPTPSSIDNHDEAYRAGLHIVVGRLSSEPPEFHAEAVVDGSRFRLRNDQVMEPYQCRSSDVPPDWIKKVTVKVDHASNDYKEQTHGES